MVDELIMTLFVHIYIYRHIALDNEHLEKREQHLQVLYIAL